MHEISIRAKYDGSFTQEWATIRRLIPHEPALRNAGGTRDIQKLRTWAEAQGLLMDFELDSVGFSSAIRTITFWSGSRTVDPAGSDRPNAHEEPPDPAADEAVAHSEAGQTEVQVGCTHHEFDWDSLKHNGELEDEAWRALSSDVDYATFEAAHPGQTEPAPQPENPQAPEDTDVQVRKHRRGVRARATRKARHKSAEVNAGTDDPADVISGSKLGAGQNPEMVEVAG